MTTLLLLLNIGDSFHDDESHINMCAVMVTNSCKKVAYFQVHHQLVNIQYNRLDEEANIKKWHGAIHVLVLKEFPPISMIHVRQSGKLYTMKDCIHIRRHQHTEPGDMSRQFLTMV